MKMLWKTCELNCEKTCELFNFTCFLTCFSHLFHRVWNCWDPVKRAVFTGSEPMQNPVKNPVSFYPVKKPVKDPVKNLLKTCELSHCFSHNQGCHLEPGTWDFPLLLRVWAHRTYRKQKENKTKSTSSLYNSQIIICFWETVLLPLP